MQRKEYYVDRATDPEVRGSSALMHVPLHFHCAMAAADGVIRIFDASMVSAAYAEILLGLRLREFD